MRRTAPIVFLIAAVFWFGIAAILAGVTLLAVIKGRQFPPVLPIAAAVAAIGRWAVEHDLWVMTATEIAFAALSSSPAPLTGAGWGGGEW